MSHSQVVHDEHYEQIRGSKEAAKAHVVQQNLAGTGKSSSEESDGTTSHPDGHPGPRNRKASEPNGSKSPPEGTLTSEKL